MNSSLTGSANDSVFANPNSAERLHMDDTVVMDLDYDNANGDTFTHSIDKNKGDKLTDRTEPKTDHALSISTADLVLDFNNSYPFHWIPTTATIHPILNAMEIDVELNEDTPPASPLVNIQNDTTTLCYHREESYDGRMQRDVLHLLEARYTNNKDMARMYNLDTSDQLDGLMKDAQVSHPGRHRGRSIKRNKMRKAFRNRWDEHQRRKGYKNPCKRSDKGCCCATWCPDEVLDGTRWARNWTLGDEDEAEI